MAIFSGDAGVNADRKRLFPVTIFVRVVRQAAGVLQMMEEQRDVIVRRDITILCGTNEKIQNDFLNKDM
jgi:hypothetical protein